MPSQVEESYFSAKQTRKGQIHGLFRTLQQALNTQRHLQESEWCAGFGYRGLSKLGAYLHSGGLKIENVLLPPPQPPSGERNPGVLSCCGTASPWHRCIGTAALR